MSEHTDITRRAAKIAHANATAAAAQAAAFDRAGDAEGFADAVEVAFDWAITELVARGEHPGALTVDAGGNVLGCTADSRPEGLTLNFQR